MTCTSNNSPICSETSSHERRIDHQDSGDIPY